MFFLMFLAFWFQNGRYFVMWQIKPSETEGYTYKDAAVDT
jgi:hypothetical protein